MRSHKEICHAAREQVSLLFIKVLTPMRKIPKDTTPSFLGFCAISADRPTNQRGGGLPTLMRDDLVFPKTGMGYNLPLERLTVQAPIQSVGITETLNFARLQMGHLTLIGGDLNAHSPLWDGTKRATHVMNSWRTWSLLTPPVSSTAYP